MNTTQEVPQYVSSDEDMPEEATTSKKKRKILLRKIQKKVTDIILCN
jgi:hypothetical protein